MGGGGGGVHFAEQCKDCCGHQIQSLQTMMPTSVNNDIFIV